jgi:hypothetical protein
VAAELAQATNRAGVRVQLIRRVGGRPRDGGDAVALADLRPGAAAVQWGTWTRLDELLGLELDAEVAPRGPQQVILVCTHGRHDVCCALAGRPVAAALASGAPQGWDVWETSHLGGERFAANVLLLPGGDLFGRLDPPGALRVVDGYRAGRIDLDHHRGRFGSPAVEQAALHQVALASGEDRRGALRVAAVEELGTDRWRIDVAHGAAGDDGSARYRVVLQGRWSAPQRLTCGAAAPSRVRRFDPVSPPARQ